jgi:hypothetical protein
MKRLLPLLTLAISAANAQCVMCFRTAAAQQVERARVLNAGIGIMLFPPVLILGGFLYLAYRRNTSYAHTSDEEGAPQLTPAESVTPDNE